MSQTNQQFLASHLRDARFDVDGNGTVEMGELQATVDGLKDMAQVHENKIKSLKARLDREVEVASVRLKAIDKP